MKFFLIAGERSGDLHGSNLIRELTSLSPEAQFCGMGGELMEKQGMLLLAHYSSYSLMGFVEVLLRYRAVKKHLRLAKQWLRQEKPDILVLIDFGGFNMRMAKFAKSEGIPTVYYIPPKVWAWNTRRAESLKKNVDQLLSILPFEKEFYRQFDWEIEYVGNPLNDSIRNYIQHEQQPLTDLPQKKIYAMLPGSRPQELKKIIPLFTDVARQQPDKLFLVAGISSLDPTFYRTLEELPNTRIILDRTYDVLLASQAAVVTSGTATLEAALLNIPQVVVYKASPLSYSIGKRLVKVSYISLVNLVLNRPLVKELLQKEANEKNVISELEAITTNVTRRREVLDGYQELKEKIGNKPASYNAAKKILERWA